MNYITENHIIDCSETLNIHKGIILGALAFHKKVNFKHLHKFTKTVINQIPLEYFADDF